MTEELRKERLTLPDGPLRVVLDTDTYNEVDDQFALAYLLSSPERLRRKLSMRPLFIMSALRAPGMGWRRAMKRFCAFYSAWERIPPALPFGEPPTF